MVRPVTATGVSGWRTPMSSPLQTPLTRFCQFGTTTSTPTLHPQNPTQPPFPTPAMGPLFLLLFLPILLPEPVSSAATSPEDAAALQSLARVLSPLPPGWTASPSSDPCSPSPKWTGVSCSSGRVTFLNLRSLSLSGSLPASSLSALTSLRSLSLQSNSLTGPLPSPLPSSLQELYLGSNNFSSLPSGFFSGLTSLVNVSLDKNPLAPWSLPDDLQQSVNLVYFTAMDSGLTGEIPAFLGKLASLQMLRLSYNQLTGSLPMSFAGSSIRELYLNNQDSKLSGPIDVIAAMPQLSTLMLQSNNFTGPIPDLTNCTSLQELNLRDNRLTGLVPASISRLPALNTLTLANNLLQGPYPDIPTTIWKDGGGSGNFFCLPTPGPCEPRVTLLLAIAEGFGYPAALANAWTGNDPCNNWLFVSCDAQQNITLLNFANQKFGGVISPEITKLTSLKNLILSNNNLHGTIPVELASMPQLESVDVSDNDLSGDLPPFKPNVKFKYSGNKLLGTGSSSSGSTSGGESGSGGSSSSGSNSSSGSGSKPSVWIAGVVVGVLVIVGVVCVFFYCRQRQHPKFRKVQVQSPPRETETVKIGMQGFVANGISHSELHSQSSSDSRSGHAIDAVATFMSMQAIQQATNNFGEGNILGRGGFGTVYKGELPDGMLIAVKRMECGEMGNKGLTEFQAEIAVLTKVRHRHLVALHGYCMEGSERLLVYEYMPQGTLAQHLFGGVEMGYASLKWKQRLIIALDVARGLEYLHSLAQKSFIHRDLKPSNILLGDDMRAKVSDFGLVKLAPDGKHSVETRLAGTFGYLAPEYATTGRVTTKVDVYAFGVVLMELITGRKALDDTLPEENTHLVTWFRRVLVSKSNVSKIADPSLDLEDDDVRSLATVAELAGHCTAREAHQRPDMGHAVNVIAPLVDQWKPSSSNAYDDNMGMSFNRSLSQRLKGWQQNEGTSMVDLDSDSHVISMENTHGSIPSKPDMFTHCR